MRVVTAAIIISDQKVLLTRRGPSEKLAGYWEFPGGKVEDEETLEDCLRRELHEELGVEAVIGEVMAESEYHYDHGSFLLVGMYASLSSKDLKLTVHDQAEWVPVEDLLSYQLAPADIPLAKHLQAQQS
jgi:8-oxo-dGTP diphosphatase